MNSVHIVLKDNGDGSQSIEWHKTMSPEKRETLLDCDFDSYASGDGLQCTELKLPENFDISEFGVVNNILWFEEDVEQS